MSDKFGPWSTDISTKGVMGLSPFWKHRMCRLAVTSRSRQELTRRDLLQLSAAGIAACVIPTLRPGVTPFLEANQTIGAQKSNDLSLRGRIVLAGVLRPPANNLNEQPQDIRAIFAIGPNTGQWTKVSDVGHSPRVSPDGQTVVFSHNEEIWNCDTGGSNNPGRLTAQRGSPVWSGDGKYIVAKYGNVIDESDNPTRPVWVVENWRVNADGTGALRLPLPETDFVEDWSADGEWLVVSTDRHPPYGSGYQLYLVRPDGTGERRLTRDGLNVYARFAPDGRRIVYSHQTKGDRIRMLDVSGGEPRTIFEELAVGNAGACWSPDGKHLAVVLNNWKRGADGKLFIDDPADADYRIMIMTDEGKDQRTLTLSGGVKALWLSGPDWR